MKKSIFILYMLIIGSLAIWWDTFALQAPNNPKNPLQNILTTSGEKILPPVSDSGAIREGTRDIITNSEGNQLANLIETKDPIKDQSNATNRIVNLIKRLINFALGLASLIALVILIGAGIQMVTAAGDEGKFNAGKTALNKVTKALLGIAVSWMIISGIFWLIWQIT